MTPFRLFCVFGATVGLQTMLLGSQPPVDSSAARFDIDRCVNTFNPARIESTKAGYQYWFADREFLDGRTLKLSVVRPREATHPPHKHSEDEFFFILEGKAEFFLDGKTRVVQPYASLYCPSGMLHGIRNAGDGELKYLVIKKYAVQASSMEGGKDSISLTGFQDSAHHWYDIRDEEREIDPLPDQPRYARDKIEQIADNILLYQKSNGGWPKNYDVRAILTSEQKRKLTATKNSRETTFDNGATHTHVQYLAEAFAKTRKDRFKEACLRGIEFILKAQLPNGGWQQFSPDTSGYRRYITFNDGAMIGVMDVLERIAEGRPEYFFVDPARREKARQALAKGVQCILRCQINDGAGLTAWCQQHDNHTFVPRPARNFEPVAITGLESTDIVLFLMSLPSPSPEVIAAVQSAVKWFDRSRIHGVRVKVMHARHAQYAYHATDIDRVLVADPTAPPLWARYYEIGTNIPLFCNRDRNLVYSLAEVERERRTGYGWYTEAPAAIFEKYPAWQQTHAPGQNVLDPPSTPLGAIPPPDTSFTTWNAWNKMLKQYPTAIPAVIPPSPAVHEWEGLVYTTYGYRHLALDLFVPADSAQGPFPVVLIIHGGGWRSGNRKMEIPMARALAARGYAAAVVEYRLSTEACYPAGVYDVKAAVRWMRVHAPEYNADPTRIAVMGPSAGGTLAALLGTTGDRKELEGVGTHPGVSSAVQAVVDIDGVVDFTDSSESGKDQDPTKPSAGKLWFGAAYHEKPHLWQQASALNWVSPSTPPFAFINSTLDRFHAGRDPLIAKLNSLGIYSEVHPIPNTPHPFWLMKPWCDETVSYVVGFLDKVLKTNH